MPSKPTSSRDSGKSASGSRKRRAPSRLASTALPASRPRSRGTSTPDTPLPAGLPRFSFVGGKGGVGKTTCAAALALAAVSAGRRTLLVSTDPASSLSDLFQLRRTRPRSGVPRRVRADGGELSLLEIDAARALERWLAPRKPSIMRVALRGSWLDEQDVSRLLSLSLPGIDELAALIEIAGLDRDPRFDSIVIDTAPTGHTLRMLTMPETLRSMARLFDRMQEKHRVMVEALRGRWTADAEDAFIEQLDRDGRELTTLLRDPARTAMSWVTLPERMAVDESLDALAALREAGMPLGRIAVNRVTPLPASRCRYCEARRGFEAPEIERIHDTARGIPVVHVAEREREPREAIVFREIGIELQTLARRHTLRASRHVVWQAAASQPDTPIPALVPSTVRLLMFGGKGGTGKTTCAAAAALTLTRVARTRRVLLLSTDPAHSLSDVLGEPAGDQARRVRGAASNLEVRELDANAAYEQLRSRYVDAIDGLFERLSRGASALDASNDRRVMHGLLDLAPPGIDELAAVIEVTDALNDENASARYDLVVMDTAPSGHALRLLETPALVQDWTRALMSILLRYQPVVGAGDLGALLVRMSQGIGRLRRLLSNREKCRFVAVTRGAALPRRETGRLLARLAGMGIDVPIVVVNAVGRGGCTRCRTAAAGERQELAAIRRAVSRRSELMIVTAPSQVPPPHGVPQLEEWASCWQVPEVR